MIEICSDCGHRFSFGYRCPKCKSTNHETYYDVTDELKEKLGVVTKPRSDEE